VILFHFFNHWVSPIHDSLAAILPRGAQVILEHADLGVEVFFVLSGFVIAHSLMGKSITPRYAGNFILRRSLRLDPAYWVVIAVSLALPYLLFPEYTRNLYTGIGGTTGVIVNMFYLPDVLWRPRILGVAWTLCLEVQFYLVFLFVLALVHGVRAGLRSRFVWLPTALGKTIFALLLAYSVHRWINLGKNDFGGRWFMFFTGVLSYWTLAGKVDRRIFIGYLSLIFGLTIAHCELRTGTVLFTAVIIYAAAHTGSLQIWLGGKAFQYLGRISYCLYLVHMTIGVTVIRLVMQFDRGSNATVFLALATAVVVSILLADLLNRLVEAPAMRLSNRLKPMAANRYQQSQSPSVANRQWEFVLAWLCRLRLARQKLRNGTLTIVDA
jgi:hypothetical protein